MTRKRHTEGQIIVVLKEAQTGVSVLVCSTREVPEQLRATGRGGDGGRGLVKGNLRQPHRLIGHSAGTGRPRALERVHRAVGRDRTMSYRDAPVPPRHASGGLPQSARLYSTMAYMRSVEIGHQDPLVDGSIS